MAILDDTCDAVFRFGGRFNGFNIKYTELCEFLAGVTQLAVGGRVEFNEASRPWVDDQYTVWRLFEEHTAPPCFRIQCRFVFFTFGDV